MREEEDHTRNDADCYCDLDASYGGWNNDPN